MSTKGPHKIGPMDGTHPSNPTVVSGPLCFALCLSRIAGMAPLQFTKLQSGYWIRQSGGFSIYSKLLAVTVCFLGFVGLAQIIIFYSDPEEASSDGTKTGLVIYIADYLMLALVVLTAAFTSTYRMINLITYLNQIRKVNVELNSYRPHVSSEKKEWISLLVLLTCGCVTFIADWFIFILTSLEIPVKVFNLTMYAFIVLLFFMRLMAQILFVMIAMTVLATIKRLNACFKDLLEDIQTEGEEKRLPLAPHEALLRLSRLHWILCDVVRQVDRGHGPLLLLLVFSYFMHLLVTLFAILSTFLNSMDQLQLYSISQLLWLFYHLSGLIVVIEPCHHTQEEMETTRELVRKMAQNLSNSESFNAVLDVFMNQLILVEVVYSPLRMCTLNRALVVSLLGSITTYLVVIMQY